MPNIFGIDNVSTKLETISNISYAANISTKLATVINISYLGNTSAKLPTISNISLHKSFILPTLVLHLKRLSVIFLLYLHGILSHLYICTNNNKKKMIRSCYYSLV